MPLVVPRPTAAEITSIQEALINSDITGRSRTCLRMVLAWARGKTARQVAADPVFHCSDWKVLSAVRSYRANGLDAFLRPTGETRGTPPLPQEKAHAVEKALRELRKSGIGSYRSIAKTCGVSLGTVAAIARLLGPAGPSRGA